MQDQRWARAPQRLRSQFFAVRCVCRLQRDAHCDRGARHNERDATRRRARRVDVGAKAKVSDGRRYAGGRKQEAATLHENLAAVQRYFFVAFNVCGAAKWSTTSTVDLLLVDTLDEQRT